MITSSQLLNRPMTQKEFPLTWSTLQSGLNTAVSPGFVVGVWQRKNPDEIRLLSLGNRRTLPTVQPLTEETVFDLASVTKVFCTATLAAKCVDRRWLSWDLPVSAVFPSYPHKSILVRHLMAHTAGFVAWQPLWENLRSTFHPTPLEKISVVARQKKMRELVFSIPPVTEVDVKAVYSDISFLLLGYVLEELTGLPIDRAVKKWVWDPLGVETAFYRRVDQRFSDESVAATELCPWRGGVIQGQVHDDNCWAMGGYGGHAGAFGRARDVLHFTRALFNGFLTPQTLREVWTRVGLPAGCERTLGWDTPSGGESSTGHFFSKYSAGHLGFTGTSLWIDPQAELGVVLLSNRVHPSRDNIKIRAFRPTLHDAVRMDLKI